MESSITNLQAYSYTSNMYDYDGKIKNWLQIDPTSFQAGFWRNCELRLCIFS